MARGRPPRSAVYARLDAALDRLRQRVGALPPPEAAEAVWGEIWHAEAHHSTALEGNTLVPREVAQLLDAGRAVGAKPLKQYLEVTGYAEAARWVYRQALRPGDWRGGGLITVTEVRQVHARVMGPVWEVAPHPEATDREGPGLFREHDIQPFGGGMTPPTWPLAPAEITGWADEVNRLAPALVRRDTDRPWPEALAKLHNDFERVHPFLDGNGRSGRLLLNLLLVRLGCPPAIILRRQRDRYLAAMGQADAGAYGPLGELLARAVYHSLNRFVVPSAAAGAEAPVPLMALAEPGLGAAALRQAARRGRLDTVQGSDGVWRASRRAVLEYKASRWSRPD
jgi:Fic family protein